MAAAMNWRTRYRKPLDVLRFPFRFAWAAANQLGWLGKPRMGSSPHLNPDALARWREAVGGSRVYLEYGAGGSSVEAAQSAAHVVSVETNRRYLAAVEARVAQVPGRGAFHPVYVDIGWTAPWGRPLVTWNVEARAARWRHYPAAPWVLLEKFQLVPDFIFIDGRFRAASALESFLRLPPEAECLFMLDDFDGRTGAYGRVLEFASAIEEFDRTITFRRKPDFDGDACAQLLERLYRDPE